MLMNVFQSSYKWFSIFIICILFLGSGLYLEFGNFLNTEIEFKDTMEISSWIFSAVVSLISFLSLFIAFVYDNKLMVAARYLKQLYKPYGLKTEEYRICLIEYEQHLSKGITIKSIYWIIFISSCASILSWAVFLKLLKINFSTAYFNIADASLIIMWILLSVLLIFLSVFLNLIKSNKNPINDGYLPDINKICDISFFKSMDTDMDEIFSIIHPTLEIYENPTGQNFDVNIIFPIHLGDYKYVFKMVDKDSRPVIRVFGYLEKSNEIGQKFYLNDLDRITKPVYDLLKEGKGEIRIYTKQNELISRISLSIERVEKVKIFTSINRTITHLNETRDLEVGAVANITSSHHQMQNEILN